MNGAHDMGGGHGHGPVIAELDEPVFHAEWERRVFSLSLAAGANRRWNIDQSRFARENTPPSDYLARSYYEIWLYGLEKLVIETGLVTATEIVDARSGTEFDQIAEPPLTASEVGSSMRRGGRARVDIDLAPLFSVGDPVRARSAAPPTHTRVPRYVRGHTGVIDRDHGVFTLPDTHAHTGDRNPQHLYAVRFEAVELWGDDADGGAVYVDLWDDYLEAAP